MNEEGISGMKAILALLYSKGPSGRFGKEVVGRAETERQASIAMGPSALRLNSRSGYIWNEISAPVVYIIPFESCG